MNLKNQVLALLLLLGAAAMFELAPAYAAPQPPPAHTAPFCSFSDGRSNPGEQFIGTIASAAFPQAPGQPAGAAMAPFPKADAGLVSTSQQTPEADEPIMACEWFCTPCEWCESDCEAYGCGFGGLCEMNSAECGWLNAKCTCYW